MSDAPNPEAAAIPPPMESPPAADAPPMAPAAPVLQPHDFRQSSLLSPRQMRKLRGHQMQFLASMESRVAMFLRAQIPLKLAGIDIVPNQKLTEGWAGPTHLVLFKAEPLRGVSVLEIPLNLGLTIVDRLMGGPGASSRRRGRSAKSKRRCWIRSCRSCWRNGATIGPSSNL